jgi:sugar lactone lactonase YvrE
MSLRHGLIAIPLGTAAWAVYMLATEESVPRSPPPPPPTEITIDGERIFPENLDADDNGNFYVTSLDGTIYRAQAGTTTAVPWIEPDENNQLLWTLGVYSHERSNTLWVCTTPAPFLGPEMDGEAAAVAFYLDTGAFKARYPLPKPEGENAPPNATCNDIAVGQRGTVYLTDTGAGRLFEIKPGASQATLAYEDPLLVGVEGPAFSSNNYLYVNNTRNNGIFRVNRNGAGDVEGLTRLNTNLTLDGADGFRHYRGNQFLQAETGGTGRVTLVTINYNDVDVKVIAEGTGSAGVTFIGDTIYTAEGKIGYLFDPTLSQEDPGEFTIKSFKIDGEDDE